MRLQIFILIGLLSLAPWSVRADTSHENFFEHYEGTETCLECHQQEAEDFFHSQHYQWRGGTPAIVNAEGEQLGKLEIINDFCTNPAGPQWIGQVKSDEGRVLARGCSSCHAGKGKMPAKEISDEQLDNIDCLICHASGYRRDLYPTGDGGWEWKPILWNNQEGLDIISKRLSSPKRVMCLRCHSASGGGPNYKRGDLEYILAKPPREHDVHMATDGPDMSCVDCHGADEHRVRGRGIDLAATDSPDKLSCDGACHGATPHESARLNSHSEKVYCATCHIPTFARSEPTDMRRDWSETHYSDEKGKYAYQVTLQSDVTPVYNWFNGKSWIQKAGEPVRRNAQGEVTMVLPQGSVDDPEAKIFPFKLHQGVLPLLEDKQWLLPIATEQVYYDGDVDSAVRHAAEYYYGITDVDYDWTETIRYMGIFHGVVPKEEALSCGDCHSEGGRMDWEALGYGSDPRSGRGKSPE